jgi:benzoate membrane transport protein
MAVALWARKGPARAPNWNPVGLCRSYTRELNARAIWAGVTTFIWYAVGLVPVQIAVIGHFGLSTAQVSSWMFIIWMSGALTSIALSLVYRQPIPITSSIPGLLFLGAAADKFSVPELMGANMMAGLLIMALGLVGVGNRVLTWLPLPLAMGMLAGTILGDVSNMIQTTVAGGLLPLLTIGGYVVGRCLRQPRIPPIALALIAGVVALALTQQLTPAPLEWQAPSLVTPEFAFTASAFVSVSLPLVVLSMGLGHVQGLGFLVAQGYRVPVNPTTFLLGLSSVVNAVFGGHTAIVSRNGMPIMAGPEAGPVNGRYWANLTASVFSLSIALAAAPVMSVVGMLPKSYVLVLAGLAILPSLQNALEQAYGGRLRFGAMVAMVVAATPFALSGLGSAFWALLVAVGVAYIVEPEELLAWWRGAA